VEGGGGGRGWREGGWREAVTGGRGRREAVTGGRGSSGVLHWVGTGRECEVINH